MKYENGKIVFLEKEKEQIFDTIAENYFNRNFGSMSKADFELLIFSEFIEICLNNDLVLDDYTLSKILGITQSRVRNLKEKKELKYPRKEFDWKVVFGNTIKNAKYNDEKKIVKVIIQDINVMNEVRHYIEEKGWYDEISLNKRLLQVPIDCFLDICMDLENIKEIPQESKEKIKELKIKDATFMKLIKDISKENIKDFSKNAQKEILCKVIDLIFPKNKVSQNIIDLLRG